MKKADTLSQQPDHDLGKGDNEERTVLKGEWFREMKLEGGEFWREIEEADEATEEEVREAVEEGRESWTKEGIVLIWKKRLYVPDSSTLRKEIISRHHESELAGHPGYTKTHELVTRNYWWPRMMSDIKRFVAGCEKCQATKPNHQQKQVQLHPNEVLSHPWETVSVDLVGPLPSSTESNGVLVVVDCFSKMARYIPISMEISSQGVAKTLWEQVFKDVGLPKKVISDRSPQFVSNFMKGICAQLGIEQNPSTAYHPQTNGQTERVNQEMEQYLWLYCSYWQDDWTEWLPMAEFAYNNWIYLATGKSPFFVNLGRHPNTGREVERSEGNTPSVDAFLEVMERTKREVKMALEKTNKVMEQKFNVGKKTEIDFQKGDLVWVDGLHYNDRCL